MNNKLFFDIKPSHLEIFKHRYGIGNYKPHTYREIGEIFGLSPARIFHIEAKTLRRLAFSPAAKDHPLRKAAKAIMDTMLSDWPSYKPWTIKRSQALKDGELLD